MDCMKVCFLSPSGIKGTKSSTNGSLSRHNSTNTSAATHRTELGHGSNVRGLETTATWNANDKTFTLHSPYLTASKWWIGSLGRTANHAVVMATIGY